MDKDSDLSLGAAPDVLGGSQGLTWWRVEAWVLLPIPVILVAIMSLPAPRPVRRAVLRCVETLLVAKVRGPIEVLHFALLVTGAFGEGGVLGGNARWVGWLGKGRGRLEDELCTTAWWRRQQGALCTAAHDGAGLLTHARARRLRPRATPWFGRGAGLHGWRSPVWCCPASVADAPCSAHPTQACPWPFAWVPCSRARPTWLRWTTGGTRTSWSCCWRGSTATSATSGYPCSRLQLGLCSGWCTR